MLQGLSRKTLNIIIIVCLSAIVWLNMAGKNQQETPLEPLNLPPLYDQNWQPWPNAEEVSVWLRAGGTIDGGTLVIRSSEQNQHIPLPKDNWSVPLYQALKTAIREQPAVILISGPWSDTEKHAMAALVIREQTLQPLSNTTELWPTCVRNHQPAALWLVQQQGQDWQNLGAAVATTVNSEQWPDKQSWAVWRLQQSRELRRHWQDEQSQIDIQADLAYHRLPVQAYTELYLSLADAQPGDVSAFQQCLTQNHLPVENKREKTESEK